MAETKTVTKTSNASKVSIMLPFVPGTLDDDVQVILNGKVYLIKRGEVVEVPAAVKEILDNQAKQLKKAADIK